MAVIAAGPAGAGVLPGHGFEGDPFTRADLEGRTTVLVFYPFAFSPVCTDQLSLYHEVLDELAARGATLYGVSCDAVWSQQAFKEQLGVDIEQLSDFEPKGAACRAFGVLHPAGLPTARARRLRPRRASCAGATRRRSPGDLPGANLLFDALDRRPADRPRLRPAAPRRPGRPRARARRRAARGGLRRLRVPVLRGAGGAAGRRSRCASAFRHFPRPQRRTRAPSRPPARPRPPAVRTRSGRCTTRSSPTRPGSRTRTCGRARSGSASTSRASTPTAAPTAVAARVQRRLPRRACAPACRPRRRCSSTAGATPGRPDEALWARLALPSRGGGRSDG